MITTIKQITEKLSRIIPNPIEPDDRGKLYHIETGRGTRSVNLAQCGHELREVSPHRFAMYPEPGARPYSVDQSRIASAVFGPSRDRRDHEYWTDGDSWGEDWRDYEQQLNCQPDVEISDGETYFTVTGAMEGIAEPVQLDVYWVHPDTPAEPTFSTLEIDAGEWWTRRAKGGRDHIHHGDPEAERAYRQSYLAGIELLDRIDDIDEFGDACELLLERANHERYCVRHTESPLPVWNDVDTRCSLTSVELARTRGILHCLATALRRTDELFERGISADTLKKTVDAWKLKVRSWATAEPTGKLEPPPDLLDSVRAKSALRRQRLKE